MDRIEVLGVEGYGQLHSTDVIERWRLRNSTIPSKSNDKDHELRHGRYRTIKAFLRMPKHQNVHILKRIWVVLVHLICIVIFVGRLPGFHGSSRFQGSAPVLASKGRNTPQIKTQQALLRTTKWEVIGGMLCWQVNANRQVPLCAIFQPFLGYFEKTLLCLTYPLFAGQEGGPM